MQTVDKYELIRILKEPNLKTFTLNTVLYAIERATIKAKSAKRRRLTDEEKHDYIDRTERRKFDSRWIPCSERLPDSKEDVLVWFEYFRYGEYNCLYQTYGIGNYNKNYDNWMVNHETGWRQLRVVAWMPMPEPPEGGAEDE